MADPRAAAAPAASSAPPPERTAIREDGKVVVSFRHAGNAPILKQSKFKLPADVRFAAVTETLRTHLRMGPEDALFLYCNSSFAPPPDELLGDVAQCFHTDGVLVLNYCCTPAWG
jgi:ubiquitin-like protein ATG12